MKKILPIILALFSFLSLPLQAQFSGGSGTEEDPYWITDYGDITSMGYYLGSSHADKHFILKNNIDFYGSYWEPLGVSFTGSCEDKECMGKSLFGSCSFQGTLHGDNYYIENFCIDERVNTQKGGGLFKCIENARIENVHFRNVHILGNENCGVLAGVQIGGKVSYCTVSESSVTGKNNVGGLIGNNMGGNIDSCIASFTHVNGVNNVGGLVGNNTFGVIKFSYAIADYSDRYVIGDGECTGGLVGRSDGGIVEKSYSDILIVGNIYVGG